MPLDDVRGASPRPVRPSRGGAPGSRRRAGRRRPHHVLAVALTTVVAALALLVFGAWMWVNSHLVREDWLTGARSGPATSWLILGSDERDGTAGGTADDTPGYRTDTILVLTKPRSGPSSLISIPRDSLAQVDGQYMKINAVAMLAGQRALTAQVEHITGQGIDHVAIIRFGGLQQVVDALGGVELCYDSTVDDPKSELHWQAGCHVADGATALAFSRMRYSDPKGDFGRSDRQRQVIGAIMSKALSRDTLANPARLAKVAEATLSAVRVDEKTTPFTLISLASAFRDATGDGGISGTVYWTNPDYQEAGVGSAVLLDDTRNAELFSSLAQGTHAPGQVGSLAEG